MNDWKKNKKIQPNFLLRSLENVVPEPWLVLSWTGAGMGLPTAAPWAGQEAHCWAGVPWDTAISPIQQQSLQWTRAGAGL